MWIHVPSVSSRSVPAPACSMSALTSRWAARCALACTSKGKRLRARSWRARWQSARSLQALSGITSTPSRAHASALTFARSRTVVPLTSSSAASPASHGRLLANRLDHRMNAIYGPRLCARLKRMNPASSGLKTSPELFPDQKAPGGSKPNWKAWATALRADYSARKNSAQITNDSGFSCWPTASARDHKGATGPDNLYRKNGQMRLDQLDRAAEYFPVTRPGETTTGRGLLLRVWTPPGCPRLNPKFSEWLMGWPPGLSACTLSAMAWTRWSRHTRSYLFSVFYANNNFVAETAEARA